MQFLRRFFSSPLLHLLLITGVIGLIFSRTNILPQDDNGHYQQFIETLAAGTLDLSIPGFHGASILAVPLYLITHSPLTNVWFQMFCAILIPAAGYWASRGILRDRMESIFFAYALALMPFLFFPAFRGFTFASFTLFLLLTLGLRTRGSAWAFLPWSISLLIKPFSIALLPLFFLWDSKGKKKRFLSRGQWQFLLAMLLPALYITAEYLQIGRIIVGAHADIDQTNVFLWQRLPLNALHGIQMLFSVHNFYFPDAAKTGFGNLTHSSPVLMLLGCFSFLYPKGLWKDERLARVLGLSCLLAFIIAAALDHMDHFYMETAVILLTLAGIPMIMKYRLLIPLVLITFQFQFFYLYLMWMDVYFPDFSLFLIPIVVDVMALIVWLLFVVPDIRWKPIVAWFTSSRTR